MSQTPLSSWIVGDKGMITCLRHGQAIDTNGKFCTVVDIDDYYLNVSVDGEDAHAGMKLLPYNVLPRFRKGPRNPHKHEFQNPSDYFQVAQEDGKGRGLQAKQPVPIGTVFCQWRGMKTMKFRFEPSSVGRRFLSQYYSGPSTPDNVAIYPKQARKLLDAYQKALSDYNGVIKAGTIGPDDVMMMCCPDARHCGELCNNGGCSRCGPSSYTLAAFQTLHVSMLDDPKPDEKMELKTNYATARERAQLVELVEVCLFVRAGFALIVFDGTEGVKSLETRKKEFQERRAAWVDLVWSTVFKWLTNAFLERPLTEEIYMVENPMQDAMDQCRRHDLTTLRQEIELLDLADEARPRNRSMHTKVRKLLQTRISEIKADIRPNREERKHAAYRLKQQPHTSVVTLHDPWLSLANGPLTDEDRKDINVTMFLHITKPDGEQSDINWTEDSVTGFVATEFIETGEFICLAYNETSSQGQGYFVNPENSIKEQAFHIPAVNAVLKHFLAGYKDNMPDYVFDYLSLCSELASHDEARPTPPRDPADYEPKEARHRPAP